MRGRQSNNLRERIIMVHKRIITNLFKERKKRINKIKKNNNHIKYRIFKVNEILTINGNNLHGINK